MADHAFTYGNILLLYCNFTKDDSFVKDEDENLEEKNDRILPDFIMARINLCIETFNIIMKSKPDKFHTSVIVVSKSDHSKVIKEYLVAGGISEQYLESDNTSKTVESALNTIHTRIIKLVNPPTIYFVGSVWQKDIYDSLVASKFKGYQLLFEGALDHRSFDTIQKEKHTEVPKKDYIYYKHKLTDKAIDTLLNYIFSNKRK